MKSNRIELRYQHVKSQTCSRPNNWVWQNPSITVNPNNNEPGSHKITRTHQFYIPVVTVVGPPSLGGIIKYAPVPLPSPPFNPAWTPPPSP